MEADETEQREAFDLIDLSYAQTMAIRMDDFVLFAVFDDSCAVVHGVKSWIDLIQGPLSPIQIRELAVHFGCCNLHLENPPQFRTRVENGTPPKVFIDGSHEGEPKFRDKDQEMFGKMMASFLKDHLQNMDIDGYTREEAFEKVRAGKMSFIMDDDGKFTGAKTIARGRPS